MFRDHPFAHLRGLMVQFDIRKLSAIQTRCIALLLNNLQWLLFNLAENFLDYQ
jgi:hypothetical protein